MNERLTELYRASKPKEALVSQDEFKSANSLLGSDVEKFAELIILECINKIETHQIPVGNSAAGEMACEWTYDALKEIRDEIKKHFGVEE